MEPPNSNNSNNRKSSEGGSLFEDSESVKFILNSQNSPEASPEAAEIGITSSPSEDASLFLEKKRKSTASPADSSAAKKPRQGQIPKKWQSPAVYTSKKSPLGENSDILREMLLSPAVWNMLGLEDHKAILAKLPDQQQIEDLGTVLERPNFDSLRNHDGFRHDCSRYSQNLSNGHHDESWLTDAWTGHLRQKRGDYDAFLQHNFERAWGNHPPDSLFSSPGAASSLSSNSITMFLSKLAGVTDTSTSTSSNNSSDKPMRAAREIREVSYSTDSTDSLYGRPIQPIGGRNRNPAPISDLAPVTSSPLSSPPESTPSKSSLASNASAEKEKSAPASQSQEPSVANEHVPASQCQEPSAAHEPNENPAPSAGTSSVVDTPSTSTKSVHTAIPAASPGTPVAEQPQGPPASPRTPVVNHSQGPAAPPGTPVAAEQPQEPSEFQEAPPSEAKP